MPARTRAMILWAYLAATAITFVGILAIAAFEIYVRWALNQNFSVLDGNAFLGLAILLAAQMIGLAWLSRPA